MADTSLRRRPLTVAAFVLVVAVFAAVLAALSVRSVSASQEDAALSTEALAAARQIAVDFAAYDYRHINDDFKRVADESVGSFHQKFLTSSASVRDLIVKAQSVSTAEVASAGVADVTSSRATVVVALNRTVDNTSLKKPQSDSFGVEITLVHQHGRWLASDVKPL